MNPGIFLRDAGVLGCKGYVSRLKRCSELARMNDISLQLTLGNEIVEDKRRIARISAVINKFTSILVHLHCSYPLRFGDNRFTSQALDAVKILAGADNRVAGICVHPDLVDDFPALASFILPGAYVGIEVLDVRTGNINAFQKIMSILDEHSFLRLVLDTAHIQERETAGEPSLRAYIDAFEERVREVHVSLWGNHYDPRLMGEFFTTSHSLFAASGRQSLPLDLSRLNSSHIVIEGVIPAGGAGRALLGREVEMLRKTTLV
jgi:hypothetical protein